MKYGMFHEWTFSWTLGVSYTTGYLEAAGYIYERLPGRMYTAIDSVTNSMRYT